MFRRLIVSIENGPFTSALLPDDSEGAIPVHWCIRRWQSAKSCNVERVGAWGANLLTESNQMTLRLVYLQ
jgi:hypothetical protein